ncbi:MAG: glycosyltransferase N-terminal domain-containing protein [Thermodesulfobacteriota bacterium]
MGWMVYQLYQLVVGVLFWVLFPCIFLGVLISGKGRHGFFERLGFYRGLAKKKTGTLRIWLHGASVGEVQAARRLLEPLQIHFPDAEFVLTTMTVTGRDLGRRELAGTVSCYLAPLDVIGAADMAIGRIDPDLYVCLETELWPLLLKKLSGRGCKIGLANGRLSENACRSYRRAVWFFRRVLENFDAMALISSLNRKYYLQLGADPEKISVLGNVKYDLTLPVDHEAIRQRCETLLAKKQNETVVVCGSTHTGEEELLLQLQQQMSGSSDCLFVFVPRHLERLEAICQLFGDREIEFQLFSRLQAGEKRSSPVVLVDCMGELFNLYSAADYVFCGGSLVDNGGHNIMEAAVWGRIVFYGPFMMDFLDATELLEKAGGAFKVERVEEIGERITRFKKAPDEYEKSCESAREAARSQEGASLRQAAILAGLIDQSASCDGVVNKPSI